MLLHNANAVADTKILFHCYCAIPRGNDWRIERNISHSLREKMIRKFTYVFRRSKFILRSLTINFYPNDKRLLRRESNQQILFKTKTLLKNRFLLHRIPLFSSQKLFLWRKRREYTSSAAENYSPSVCQTTIYSHSCTEKRIYIYFVIKVLYLSRSSVPTVHQKHFYLTKVPQFVLEIVKRQFILFHQHRVQFNKFLFFESSLLIRRVAWIS